MLYHGKVTCPILDLFLDRRSKTSGMGITASSTTPPATPKAEKFGSTTPRNGNASGLGDLRERDLVLKYIKTHTILGFEPVDYLDDVRRKETAGLLGAGYSIGNALPVGRLGSAGVSDNCTFFTIDGTC